MRYDTEYQAMKGFIFTLFLFTSLNLWASDLPRLISTAPSITESVKYFGGEETLVGVSNFCQVNKKLVRIGSAVTPNFEKIVSLKPTKVLVAKTSSSKIEVSLKKIKLDYVTLGFNGLDEILESIKKIGSEVDRKQAAAKFIKDVKAELNPIKDVIEKTYLWVISTDFDGEMVNKVMVAGTGTHYHQIVKMLGLDTPKGILPNYHNLSLEQMIKMKPDYVFISAPGNVSKEAMDKMKKAWEKTTILPAVKNKRVFFFQGDEFVVPGTSILNMIKKVKEALSAS
jgi:iron complex transport system substrate-binding protein